MSTVAIIIKTDPAIKKEAQKTAKQMGLSLSAVINSFLHQFVHTKELHLKYEPNKETAKSLKEIRQEIKDDKNVSKRYNKDNINEAFKR